MSAKVIKTKTYLGDRDKTRKTIIDRKCPVSNSYMVLYFWDTQYLLAELVHLRKVPDGRASEGGGVLDEDHLARAQRRHRDLACTAGTGCSQFFPNQGIESGMG